MRLPVFVAATIVLSCLHPSARAQEEDAKKGSVTQPLSEVQDLPDAPIRAALSTPAPAATDPITSIWHQNWYEYYAAHHRSNREVLSTKSFWAFVGTDLLASSFDAEMSRHQGRCVEGAEGLPLHPTRWQLYRHNLPENAAVILVGFLETKARMPRWLMFTGDVYPIQAHLRAGLKWRQCW